MIVLLALAALAATVPKTTELHFGSEPWHLELALGELKPSGGAESRPDRKVYTYADKQGTVLSVIVENAHEPANIEGCREVFQRRKADIQPNDEVQVGRGDAVMQEYDWKLEFQGKPVVQHNVFVCRVRGTYYIDVHASKIPYVPSDRGALLRLVDAVTLIDPAP
ncbi:MAG TPA: hypothetical protein VK533_14745 [Sphingomonas sp.]|uniref:hypothetical protein n=1 Tax=Sphingomonas sp. TaxID=28214 RepID=UPI002CE996C0|nr:hypothetical protein [Sphingomonas sp.]HMI20792.1 hypothetical protein [Sphingomonas sp.]